MASSINKIPRMSTNIPLIREPTTSFSPTADAMDVGGDFNPIYVLNGKIVPSSGTLGNEKYPLFLEGGTFKTGAELAPIIAPSFRRTTGGGATTDDVPTSPTPTDTDPSTMIATKGYCDAIGARATKVTVSPKTTVGSVICAITVDGTEFLVYNGGGGGGGTIETICVPLLTPMWFDHLLIGDSTWVESQCTADQSTDNALKSIDYPKIYAHLYAEYTSSLATEKTDTYTLSTGSTVTITYKECADGHKICALTADNLSKLNQIFNDDTIGTAWYFALTGDSTSGTFHLPRTKYGFHGNRSYVKRTQAGEQSMRLFFYTGVGPTSADKMDRVAAGIGTFTETATYANVATFQANNGQVEDSGHKIVNPDAPVGSDLVTVDYLTSKFKSTELTGTPTTPTPADDCDEKQIANVEWVKNKISEFDTGGIKPINAYKTYTTLATSGTTEQAGYLILRCASNWDQTSRITIYINNEDGTTTPIYVGGQLASGADAVVESSFCAYVNAGFQYSVWGSNYASAILLHD